MLVKMKACLFFQASRLFCFHASHQNWHAKCNTSVDFIIVQCLKDLTSLREKENDKILAVNTHHCIHSLFVFINNKKLQQNNKQTNERKHITKYSGIKLTRLRHLSHCYDKQHHTKRVLQCELVKDNGKFKRLKQGLKITLHFKNPKKQLKSPCNRGLYRNAYQHEWHQPLTIHHNINVSLLRKLAAFMSTGMMHWNP